LRKSSLQAGRGSTAWNVRGGGARRRQRLRLGLAFLGFGAGVVGLWALAWPRSFYDDFPGAGMTWLAELPKYSQHLVRDVGALNLAFLLLFVWAAVTLDRTLVRACLCAWLVFAVPHFIFHLFNLEGHSSSSAFSQMTVLGVGTALPLLLLYINEKTDSRSGRRAY
jgi:hypothetical protein